MSLVLQEQDDRLRGLINMGKARGYVLSDEVDEILPGETHTAAEVGGRAIFGFSSKTPGKTAWRTHWPSKPGGSGHVF